MKPEVVLLKRKEDIMGEVKKRRQFNKQVLESRKQLRQMQVRPPGCFAGNFAMGANLESQIRKDILEDEPYPSYKGLLFVIMVPGVRRTPQLQRIFKALGIDQKRTIGLVHANPAVCRILSLLQSQLIWGEAREDVLQQLLFKAGVARNGGKLEDNVLIEQKLGELDVLCVQDLAHELITYGKHFKECRQFLAQFQGVTCQRLDVDENEVPCVRPGYRGRFINDYVLAMI